MSEGKILEENASIYGRFTGGSSVELGVEFRPNEPCPEGVRPPIVQPVVAQLVTLPGLPVSAAIGAAYSRNVKVTASAVLFAGPGSGRS